ncbi:MAG: Spy/CpxP family protein refolding chaperone [Betaproteobacteria bacterium]|nr:Spy/CpxP family protein refolding chaperone [Betaproteobacteria bacterium]
MKKIHTVMAAAVAALSIAAATATFAQPFGGPGYGPGAGMGMGMGHRHGPMAGADPSVMVESRLADMKTLLQITAAQESAWQAFTAAARQQAAGMQAMRTQMQQDAGTAPERMAQRSAMMQQRSAAMATMSTAFGALYAVLTPAQKAVADQHGGMMSQRGMRHGPRGS